VGKLDTVPVYECICNELVFFSLEHVHFEITLNCVWVASDQLLYLEQQLRMCGGSQVTIPALISLLAVVVVALSTIMPLTCAMGNSDSGE
jgi:hypothetical protein